MKAFDELFRKDSLCRSLNASFIALIPNKRGVVELKDYMSIRLLGSFYKLLAKLLARRLVEVLEAIIS